MNCQIKYKPTTLADVIYPNESVREFINTVARGDLIQNIIFYGPNGTGKTTVADRRWCTINKYLYNRCLASGISA